MPDYVCPLCGVAIVSGAVLIEGTMMHYNCARKAGRVSVPRRPERLRRAS